MYNKNKELNILIKANDGVGYAHIHSFDEGKQDGFCHSTIYKRLIQDSNFDFDKLDEEDTIKSKERTIKIIVNNALKRYNVNMTVEELPETLLVNDKNEAIKYLFESDEAFILFQTK